MKTTHFLAGLYLMSVFSGSVVPAVHASEYKAGKTKKAAAATGPTVAAVQTYITRKEKILATGVGGQHKSVTVSFESVRFAASRKATRRDRLVNGITGPVIYPARVKYTSHRRWGNGSTEDVKIHYAYEFYKDEYGDWNAYMVGPVN